MKKILVLILMIIIVPFYANALGVQTNSNNILLYNLKDNEIIYKKNSLQDIKIASLTKIVTVIVALEHIDNIQSKVVLDYNVFDGLAEANASIAGFNLNEEVSYEDLLYGAMLPSGADATNALSINIFKNEKNFVAEMNKLAKKVGANNTSFTNTSGLDQEGQQTNLEDFLKIYLYALKNKEFTKIFSAKRYLTSNKRITLKSSLLTLSYLHDINSGMVTGSKTGYTDEAGLCLASYSKNKEMELLLITAGAEFSNPYYPLNVVDAVNIYDYYHNNYSYQKILSKNQIITKTEVKYSKLKSVNIIYKGPDVIKLLPNINSKPEFRFDIDNKDYLTFLDSTKKSVGTFDLFIDEKSLASGDLYLESKINFSLIEYIKSNVLITLTVISSTIIVIKVLGNKRKQ